ncbi:hypothetical protein FJ938_27365 [Mesorhizobium sp. B2-4-14]|uniref:hypothetical protein n=1 Tax=Mesorhizobium sp. B2-4-14 TaxID=2589935 RepID=UPI00112E08C4|nr:hypothetical protein [Mesorhizobium sp. B2-4-14]TPK96296.1 hypothetical protein FJ938_27365 [Mesorhizobium sp. B2-4-14]
MTPKKTIAAGQQIEGETSDEAKAGDKEPKAASQPPKPPAPPKPEVAEDELTTADLEAIRQARAMFQ